MPGRILPQNDPLDDIHAAVRQSTNIHEVIAHLLHLLKFSFLVQAYGPSDQKASAASTEDQHEREESENLCLSVSHYGSGIAVN